MISILQTNKYIIRILIMGIPYLNLYIKQNTTKKSIYKQSLSSLYGKIISVDISIYLYRFLGENALLENLYIMMSLFRYYNITPIFVFDGKAPIEKYKLLIKRQNNKDYAEKQYNCIKEKIKDIHSDKEQEELYKRMQILKKSFIRLKTTDYIKIKELMNAFGVLYIEANGEADALCAKLVIKKIAYACLSEDMDLFVYGCPRVIRYLSLINETFVIYNLNNILLELKLSFNEFKEICIISGTDYNINTNNNINLYKILEYFELYKNSKDFKYIDFYTWLDNNYNFIENIYSLYDTYNIFLTNNVEFKKIKVKIKNEINLDKIKEIMKPEGFIFLEGDTH